jgi:hypothetical protein
VRPPGRSRPQNPICSKLVKGPDAAKAIDTVLKKPEDYSTLLLYSAAGAAFKEKRLEDSAFLFYAAQLRKRFDRECFPPKGSGGNSPFVAFQAVDQAYGTQINPALMAEPKMFEKVRLRLNNWQPKASKDYDPGYEFKERKTEKEAHEAVKAHRTDYLKTMSGLSALLNDAEYFAAFNLGPERDRPTKEAYEKARNTMKRMEKAKGLESLRK